MSGSLPSIRSAATPPLRWQRPHSSGTLRTNVGDVGKRWPCVSWALWQVEADRDLGVALRGQLPVPAQLVVVHLLGVADPAVDAFA